MATYYVGPMFFAFEPQGASTQKEKICAHCGTTLNDIRKTSVVGCAHCYKTFEEELVPWIMKTQGSLKHIGKIGATMPVEVRQEHQLDLLKKDLQEAIQKERYEDAAIIRDKIAAYKTEDQEENDGKMV